MRQLIQFMIRHPQPTRGSHDHRHPKLMYHFYVRNFYITVAKSLQEPHLAACAPCPPLAPRTRGAGGPASAPHAWPGG